MRQLIRRCKASRPYTFARELRGWVRFVQKKLRSVDRRVFTLEPEGAVRGNALLAYKVHGFFEAPDSPVLRFHTQLWESMQMARTWRDFGFRVDVIDNYNDALRPPREYRFFVGTRMILEALGRRLNPDCIKILHIDTAHWVFHALAQYGRLHAAQQRRGVSFLERKLIEPNRAIEYAECATMLGNGFTEGTYAYAGKPIYRLPISSAFLTPWPEAKDFQACRTRFLWFGSQGMLHKGLDLVLEAFAGMPDLHLTVCGPTHEEKDFTSEYHRELFQTPSIHTVGWVDVQSTTFARILEESVALVYPSCSEGASGGVVTCMHGAVIPIVSREVGIDVGVDFGVILPDCSVEELRRAVRQVASLSAEQLRAMARKAWEFARGYHTRERFAERYREVVGEILRNHGERRTSLPGPAEQRSTPAVGRGRRGVALAPAEERRP